jgi:hypothetical protein
MAAAVFPGLRPGLTESAFQAEGQGVILRDPVLKYFATPDPTGQPHSNGGDAVQRI